MNSPVEDRAPAVLERNVRFAVCRPMIPSRARVDSTPQPIAPMRSTRLPTIVDRSVERVLPTTSTPSGEPHREIRALKNAALTYSQELT
jgi:hypothetical protein